MSAFRLVSDFVPKGDQPRAIESLVRSIESGNRHQVLLGVTGSGKTFTMASVIAACGRPALVMAPNKTLAAQLFAEFRELFPENAVEYFVSYYDYYQPEAYIPQSDTYIEKDSAINEAIDRMRHSATRSLLTRRDVIIVASVSCIYGLGSPEEYREMHLFLKKGEDIALEEIKRRLVAMLYERNDIAFSRGTFRSRGDVLEIFPVYEEDRALRIEMFGDTVEEIRVIDPLTGRVMADLDEVTVFAGSHFVTSDDRLRAAIEAIREEERERVAFFERERKLLEAQRIAQRTDFDLEMINELGYCNGIENYSRHLTGRAPGEPPPTLLDYFPDDFILFIDESHITVPQIGGMYRGDRSRKQTLVDYGFRLPSALDNRPLRFEEFEARVGQAVYVSATPGDYELERAGGVVIEQIIRPTGLMDPRIEVRPAANQVDDLLHECRLRAERGEAVLVTTLTKRMAEDLTDYLDGHGVRVRYLHSEVNTIERMELVRDLRRLEYNVLVGINLLREGLDLPEVSLVAILDADREGFLRSERSLIQTCGRAARNVDGMVIMYADRITPAMRTTIDETARRRRIQEEYNRAHGITPETVRSRIKDVSATIYEKDYVELAAPAAREEEMAEPAAEFLRDPAALRGEMERLEKQMRAAAAELAFEEAARLRDEIARLREMELQYGGMAD